MVTNLLQGTNHDIVTYIGYLKTNLYLVIENKSKGVGV